MSPNATVDLETLHQSIGTNRATIGKISASRKDGAIHIEVTAADGNLVVKI
jgi:hypothetical protein